VSHASSLSIKRKKNSKEKKYIKSRKIEKRKRKKLALIYIITVSLILQYLSLIIIKA